MRRMKSGNYKYTITGADVEAYAFTAQIVTSVDVNNVADLFKAVGVIGLTHSDRATDRGAYIVRVMNGSGYKINFLGLAAMDATVESFEKEEV